MPRLSSAALRADAARNRTALVGAAQRVFAAAGDGAAQLDGPAR